MRRTHTAFTMGVLALLCAALSAAAGPIMSYKGTLSDESGTALPDGRYSVVFSVYDAEESKEPVWTETHQVNLADGAYQALLGAEKEVSFDVGGPLWLEVHRSGQPEGSKSQVLLLAQAPIGTEQIKDKAVTAAKLEEGLGLKLAYNSYSDSSTTEERTEVVLKEYTLPAHSFSSMLIVQVTGEAYAFEGYLNVYIGGTLAKTMHVRTSDAPWSPYTGGFSGCTIVKRNLDWNKPVEIRVVGYLAAGMPGLDPPQQITCNSLTVMGS